MLFENVRLHTLVYTLLIGHRRYPKVPSAAHNPSGAINGGDSVSESRRAVSGALRGHTPERPRQSQNEERLAE